MSTAFKERETLKAVYPGEMWRKKVDKMSEEQVIAIYKRLQAQGKI